MKALIWLQFGMSVACTLAAAWLGYSYGFSEGAKRARGAALIKANVVLADILDAREKAG